MSMLKIGKTVSIVGQENKLGVIIDRNVKRLDNGKLSVLYLVKDKNSDELSVHNKKALKLITGFKKEKQTKVYPQIFSKEFEFDEGGIRRLIVMVGVVTIKHETKIDNEEE